MPRLITMAALLLISGCGGLNKHVVYDNFPSANPLSWYMPIDVYCRQVKGITPNIPNNHPNSCEPAPTTTWNEGAQGPTTTAYACCHWNKTSHCISPTRQHWCHWAEVTPPGHYE